MSVIYLYAITDPLSASPEGPGMEDAPLQLLQEEGLTAVYSAHPSLEPSPDPDALWRHDLVVEELMALGAVLPVRFGTTFPDIESTAAALKRQRRRLLEQLGRVRGCVELAVRVRVPKPDAPDAESGRSYLDAKLAARRQRESGAARTLARLREHAVASAPPPRGSEETVLHASFLVRAEEVGRFTDQVRELQRRETELALSCTGPWAPYSFAGVQEP